MGSTCLSHIRLPCSPTMAAAAATAAVGMNRRRLLRRGPAACLPGAGLAWRTRAKVLAAIPQAMAMATPAQPTSEMAMVGGAVRGPPGQGLSCIRGLVTNMGLPGAEQAPVASGSVINHCGALLSLQATTTALAMAAGTALSTAVAMAPPYQELPAARRCPRATTAQAATHPAMAMAAAGKAAAARAVVATLLLAATAAGAPRPPAATAVAAMAAGATATRPRQLVRSWQPQLLRSIPTAAETTAAAAMASRQCQG